MDKQNKTLNLFKYDYVDSYNVVTNKTNDIYETTYRYYKGIYPKDEFGTIYGTGCSFLGIAYDRGNVNYPGYDGL